MATSEQFFVGISAFSIGSATVFIAISIAIFVEQYNRRSRDTESVREELIELDDEVGRPLRDLKRRIQPFAFEAVDENEDNGEYAEMSIMNRFEKVINETHSPLMLIFVSVDAMGIRLSTISRTKSAGRIETIVQEIYSISLNLHKKLQEDSFKIALRKELGLLDNKLIQVPERGDILKFELFDERSPAIENAEFYADILAMPNHMYGNFDSRSLVPYLMAARKMSGVSFRILDDDESMVGYESPFYKIAGGLLLIVAIGGAVPLLFLFDAPLIPTLPPNIVSVLATILFFIVVSLWLYVAYLIVSQLTSLQDSGSGQIDIDSTQWGERDTDTEDDLEENNTIEEHGDDGDDSTDKDIVLVEKKDN